MTRVKIRVEDSPPLRERLNSLTFISLLQACALAALLMLPLVVLAETNLRAADQIVRQAKAWNSAGKYEEARDALVRYLERDSRSVVARLEYARTLSYLRQFSEALAEYQHVLKLEPENLEARVGVASVASCSPCACPDGSPSSAPTSHRWRLSSRSSAPP